MQFSCKQDPPIYPDDPDFVPYKDNSTSNGNGSGNGTGSGTNTGTGSGTGAGTTITQLQLNGTWNVSKFYFLSYDNTTLVDEEEVFDRFDFSKIVFNSATGTAVYTWAGNTETKTTYTLGNGTIMFKDNPFLSINGASMVPIKISNVTTNSFTMTFIDPVGGQIGSVMRYTGQKAVLVKQ